jgi:predicted metalloprotease
MRLEDERESSSVEDRRGGGGGFGIGVGGAGIGTVVIALVASYFFGIDPRIILGIGESMQGQSQTAQHPIDPAKDPEGAMVSEVKKVLAKTEDTWEAIFKQGGGQYRRPSLVLYRNVTPTACGSGQAAAGPFYCPGDEKIYLDLSFFDQMARRFRAGGDFARAYVIAHEVGHHVQRLTGITAKTDALRQRLSPAEYNKVSVRSSCRPIALPGSGRSTRTARTRSSTRETSRRRSPRRTRSATMRCSASRAASSCRIRSRTAPPAQRVRWFRTGFESGSLRSCDTFNAASL